MTEWWRDVVGFPGYVVSSYGHIAYAETLSTLLQHKTIDGYLTVYLSNDARAGTLHVEDIVAAAFLGKKPEGKTVVHKNGNRAHNHVTNLEYGDAPKTDTFGKKLRDKSIRINGLGHQVRIIETGETFPSMTHAARALKIAPGSIRTALLKRNGKYRDWTFERIEKGDS